ncbi:MAG TPA: pyrimidine dimer DNA glycosylase/endonuclease V [bacterium]|nr:pyrimidine dimer DNA glycosylase/endonuclease V [bacterium]
MRLWSLHPKYLDRVGLVALWREGLLARKVLEGKTKGYKKHPQLERFSNYPNKIKAIDSYLFHVYKEAFARNYSFDLSKIQDFEEDIKIPISFGQIRYEFSHLQKKLKDRDRKKYLHNQSMSENLANEIFTINKDILSPESWEKRAE